MTQPFRLGDIVIIKTCQREEHQYVGKECTIIGELKNRMVRGNCGKPIRVTCYRIAVDGKEMSATPSALVRRPPRERGDLDRVVAWKNCPWQPREARP